MMEELGWSAMMGCGVYIHSEVVDCVFLRRGAISRERGV